MPETTRDGTQYLELGHLRTFMKTFDILIGKPADHNVEQDDKSHAKRANLVC